MSQDACIILLPLSFDNSLLFCNYSNNFSLAVHCGKIQTSKIALHCPTLVSATQTHVDQSCWLISNWTIQSDIIYSTNLLPMHSFQYQLKLDQTSDCISMIGLNLINEIWAIPFALICCMKWMKDVHMYPKFSGPLQRISYMRSSLKRHDVSSFSPWLPCKVFWDLGTSRF